MKTLLKIAIVVIFCAILGGAAAWYFTRPSGPPAAFRTAEVQRGEIVATISATGTVEPEELVDVGAQVAGQILEFGKDKSGKAIDYGSHVEQGMVLAKIDPALYASDVAEAQAQLGLAQAGVQRAEADLGQLKAKLVQAEADWKRAEALGPSEALARTEYDAFRAVYETAKANVAVGDAAIVQAKHSVDQSQSMVDRAQRNLGYTTIASPVSGVIIDRRVNIGQTVVSSLNAPSLFLIAKDLTRMQIWVSVNEADIGQIHSGQNVTFTTDAFPGQTFKGEVNKVRYNASMTQNVVTYTVEVTTNNSDNKLLPYLTANVQFEVTRHPNVLIVPNAALHWTPTSQEQVVPEARQTETKSATRTEGAATRRSATTRPARDPATRGNVWIKDGDLARPIRVQVGATDGVNTEVKGDQLEEGAEVIIGEERAQTSADSGGTTNPFAPTMPRGGGRR